MVKRSIHFAKGEYYHIYNRGAGRGDIFFEKSHYEYVLRQSKKYARKFAHSIISSCLLPNHYHFLIRQDDEIPISKFPLAIFGGYSRTLHYQYGKTGTIFEGRFKAKHVNTDDYLIQLCYYIHANPVRAGLVQRAEDWLYSDFLDWTLLRRNTKIDDTTIPAIIAGPESYQRLFNLYLQENKLPDRLDYLEDF